MNTSINPSEDGSRHINVYSRGATSLGRFLSNFASIPGGIETEDGVFRSVEGYWYWLGCGDDRLREVSGYAAKHLGRELRAPDWQDSPEFKRKICGAIVDKMNKMPPELIAEDKKLAFLPLMHYYVIKGRVIEPTDGRWVLDCIESQRIGG